MIHVSIILMIGWNATFACARVSATSQIKTIHVFFYQKKIYTCYSQLYDVCAHPLWGKSIYGQSRHMIRMNFSNVSQLAFCLVNHYGQREREREIVYK